jgi:hypothetical protein
MPIDVFFTAARAPDGIDRSRPAKAITIAIAIREKDRAFT